MKAKNTKSNKQEKLYWWHNYLLCFCHNVFRAHMKLTIKSLSLGDFGNYRCISKNSLGETEGSIRVYGTYNLNTFFILLLFIFDIKKRAVASSNSSNKMNQNIIERKKKFLIGFWSVFNNNEHQGEVNVLFCFIVIHT